MVAPITQRCDPVTKMGNTRVFMPDGIWFDFFNGRRYAGSRNYTVYRSIYDIPVFARAGAIIPQAVLDGTNDTSNPKHLKIDIFPGKSHIFALYEDDGITLKYKEGDSATTELNWNWSENPIFTIKKPYGNTSLIPEKRSFTLSFRSITECKNVKVTIDGISTEYKSEYNDKTLTLTIADVCGELKIEFLDKVQIADNDYKKEIDELLMKLQMSNLDKQHISNLMHRENNPSIILNEIADSRYDPNIRNAITEIVLAQG